LLPKVWPYHHTYLCVLILQFSKKVSEWKALIKLLLMFKLAAKSISDQYVTIGHNVNYMG